MPDMKAASVLLTALASCAPSTWYRVQLGLEASAVAGLACDGGETRQFLAESNWQETNPVLGARPSSGALWLYLGAVAIAMLGADHALDHYAPTWGPRVAAAIAGAVTVAEIHANAVNIGVGASACGVGVGGPWKTLPDGEAGARRM
jgi:hypothetical protein